MSGGGASPSEKFAWVRVAAQDVGADIVLIAANGTVKLPVVKNSLGLYDFMFAESDGRISGTEPLSDWGADSTPQQLAKIYGLVDAKWEPTGVMDEALITVMGHTVSTKMESVVISANDIYGDVGFVDGCTIGQNSAGEYTALVNNGKLYVLLSDYDEDAGDNKTISGVSLNITNGLASLGEMLSRPQHFIRYSSLRGTWSEVESYLHQHSPLEVVGLIVPHAGIAGETVIGFPGITYSNTL